MTQQIIDNTLNAGEAAQTAFGKCNSNFTELYANLIMPIFNNVTITPLSGVGLTVTAVSDQTGALFHGAVVITPPTSGAALSVTGAATGASALLVTGAGVGTTLATFTDTGNINGANLVLTGSGANASKFIRANSGSLQVLNSAYTALLLSITDAGALSTFSSVGNTASFTSVGTNAGVNVFAPATFAANLNVAANGNTAAAALLFQQDSTGVNAFIRNLSTGSLNLGVGGTNYFSIASTGATTHSAPASGNTLTVTQQTISNALVLNATGNATNGSALLNFDASGNFYMQGTAASTAVNIGSFSASTTLALITSGSNRIQVNATGNVSINAPTSGQALTATAAVDLGGILINGAQNNVSLTINNTQSGATANWRISSVATGSAFPAGALVIGGAFTNLVGISSGGAVTIVGSLGINGASPPAQPTGYGTPTGGSRQASFAAGSITLPNLAAAVAQLIIDLKAYGILGT